MPYSFIAQNKGAKILLQSDREDYGKTDNPTYVLDNVVQSPPGTFGLLGIEKMHFQQPVLFTSAYLNTTMNFHTPSSMNAADILPANQIIAQSQPLVSTDFTLTFTSDGIPYHITLADIRYDGSGGLSSVHYEH